MRERSGWFIGLGVVLACVVFTLGLMMILEPTGLKILCIEIFVACMGLYMKFSIKDEYDYYRVLEKDENRNIDEVRLNKKIKKYKFLSKFGILLFVGGIIVFGLDFHSELEKRDEAMEIAKNCICPVYHYKLEDDVCPVCGLKGYPLYILKRMPYYEFQYSFEYTNFDKLTNCRVNHLEMASRTCPECGQVKSEIFDYFNENFRCVCGNSIFEKGATKCPVCGRDIKRSVVKKSYLEKPTGQYNYGVEDWGELFKKYPK